MKFIGIALIILGLLGFALGGVSFTQEEKVADIGPLEVEKQEQRTIPVMPLASGAAVVAGLVLVMVDARRTKSS